jgi:hypothetical protein
MNSLVVSVLSWIEDAQLEIRVRLPHVSDFPTVYVRRGIYFSQ